MSWEAKRFILLVVFFTTCILPMLAVAIMALNPKFSIAMNNKQDRIWPLASSSIFYYFGYELLRKVSVVPEFKFFMLATVLVIIGLLLISFKWKISLHMASLGGLLGALLAMCFRNGVNPIYSILLVVIVSGLVGTARLLLLKHNIWQLIAGYVLGFLILYLVIYFV